MPRFIFADGAEAEAEPKPKKETKQKKAAKADKQAEVKDVE